MHILAVAQREIKLGLRNAWTYSFLILLSIFTTAILSLQVNIPSILGYTNLTGAIINVTLYLLPLTSLLLGGFSVALEKEDGQWELLSTYPISVYTFLFGKWLGLSVILFTMLLFSFGIAGMITLLFGKAISLSVIFFFLLFSISLAFVYLSIAVFIGSIVKNRWHSLVGGIIIWFITIILWPLLMISLLSQLPSYQLVKPTLQIATIFNPAEFIRLFSILRIDAGTMFGAEYDHLISWGTSTDGFVLFLCAMLIWMIAPILIGGFIWSRGENNA